MSVVKKYAEISNEKFNVDKFEETSCVIPMIRI